MFVDGMLRRSFSFGEGDGGWGSSLQNVEVSDATTAQLITQKLAT